jgi:hypothetical protein
LLCTTILDATNSQGLWLRYEPSHSNVGETFQIFLMSHTLILTLCYPPFINLDPPCEKRTKHHDDPDAGGSFQSV